MESKVMNIKLIRNVRATLNEISVKGEDNLDMLLGCIRALKTVEAEAMEPDEVIGGVDSDAE